MDARLHEAALMGDVDSLSTLLEGNANILDGAADFAETPLHVAALFGHLEFAKVVLSRKPKLASVLDSERSSPLHFASAKGHVEMVKELLKIDPDMCLVRDKDGRIPLHVAALNGNEEVVKVLVDKKRTATRVLTSQREPILHLCVNHARFDSVKWLLDCVEDGKDNEFVKMKDHERNTILHLAVAKKHIKLTEFLVRKTVMRAEVNALNAHGFTALDVLLQNRRKSKDMKLEGILRAAGAKRAGAMHPTRDDWTIKSLSPGRDKWKKHSDWLNEIKSGLMVVAVLIATVTFQAGFTPPGGLTQEDKSDAPQLGYPISPTPANLRLSPVYTAGKSIMAIKYPLQYEVFSFFNSVAFLASLSIILLLLSGFQLKRRIFIWTLMIITWLAVYSMIITYRLAYIVVSGDGDDNTQSFIIGISFLMCFLFIVTLFATHFFRFIRWLVRKPIYIGIYRIKSLLMDLTNVNVGNVDVESRIEHN